ncbi:MAG: RagB/SusD family nutrient uptake outer membrane protein [Paludibacteraceae bacterium]|nr:RagB/SusD family nutrient uptake outer membrane protein [Paludibacteraceae bacterium]
MKIENIKYKAIILGLGAASLFTTSCSDFLDGEIADKYSSNVFSSYENMTALTATLYGGKKWSDYEAKFNWVINEGLAGNLYNTYQNEGMPFLLQIGEQNDICTDGYRALYSGVIATANQIINMDFSSSDMSDDQKNQIIAEARLFRGFAHFLATEYWGEVPLVLNNEKDIAENKMLPRVTRKTLYTAIKQDLEFAEANLPAAGQGLHATKWAAKGLLAKLYLTLAACQNPTPKCSFVSSSMGLSAAQCYEKVTALTTEIINSKVFTLQDHASIFKYQGESTETIFAIRFNEGQWQEGAQYQCQMARSEKWSPGAGWGSGKGLSYTLYKSYADNDPRKKEVCIYVGSDFTKAPQYLNVNAGLSVSYTKEKNILDEQTSKDLLEAIPVLNNIKKYVYGAKPSDHFMSGWARYDVLRLSDIYMMRQEAKMLNGNSVTTPCSDLADLNEVLSAHGAPLATGSMAFYTKLDGETTNITISIGGTDYTSRNGSANFQPKTDEVTGGYGSITMYHNQKRTDFIQELRKEFAMEGRGWLDLKRFYYMDPSGAANFLKEQDRGCAMTRSGQHPDGADELYDERGYARLSLVNDILRQRMATEDGLKVSQNEQTIYIDKFVNDFSWFIPFPASAEITAKLDMGAAQDLSSAVIDGSYPY